MVGVKPKSLLVREISKNLLEGRRQVIAAHSNKALQFFEDTCRSMERLYLSAGAEGFVALNEAHGWFRKLLPLVDAIIPYHETTPAGAFQSAAIARYVSLHERLLVLASQEQKLTYTIHIRLAHLLRDPDCLEAFDYHYRAALSAAPNFGNAYLDWADVYESSQSSKERRHAIEILEAGQKQTFYHEGETVRIQILKRLINRCTKEKQLEKAEAYTQELHKIYPVVPVAANLNIRRTGPCPCGSGKSYRNCCGHQK